MPTPDPVTAEGAAPIPFPERPTMYAILSPNASTSGWGLSCGRSVNNYDLTEWPHGSVLVTIRGTQTPEKVFPRRCAECGKVSVNPTLVERRWPDQYCCGANRTTEAEWKKALKRLARQGNRYEKARAKFDRDFYKGGGA